MKIWRVLKSSKLLGNILDVRVVSVFGLLIVVLVLVACGGGSSSIQAFLGQVTYDDSAFLAQDWVHTSNSEGVGGVLIAQTSKGTSPTELSIVWDLVPSGGLTPKGWALSEMIDQSHIHYLFAYKRAVVRLDFSFRAVLHTPGGGMPEVG